MSMAASADILNHNASECIVEFEPTTNSKESKSLAKRLKDAGFVVSTVSRPDSAAIGYLMVSLDPESMLSHAQTLNYFISDGTHREISLANLAPHVRVLAELTPAQRVSTVLDKLDQICLSGLHFVRSVSAKHDLSQRSQIWKLSRKSIFTWPISQIRDYYGEKVAFYFAFMLHYTAFLIPPAALGGLLWAFRPAGETVDDSPWVPFFSVGVVVWAALYLKTWRRKCATLSYEWGTFDWEKREANRPEYYGNERQNPITGLPEIYYSSWRRLPKYFVSLLVSLLLLVVAFAFMCCSLNMQGYIHSRHSFMFIEILEGLAEPDAMFDPNSYVMWLIPTMMHSIVIMLLNRIYLRGRSPN
eukprot:266394_1